MRRLTSSLGTLAAGALLALALPAVSANAAQGALLVNDMQQMNPQGCIETGVAPSEMRVTNYTDHIVRVHLLPNCQGSVTAILMPEQSSMSIGSSVEVVD